MKILNEIQSTCNSQFPAGWVTFAKSYSEQLFWEITELFGNSTVYLPAFSFRFLSSCGRGSRFRPEGHRKTWKLIDFSFFLSFGCDLFAGFVSNKGISFKYKVGFHKGIPRIDSSNISPNNKNQQPTFNLNAPLEPNLTWLYWFGLGLRETVALYHNDPSVSYYPVWLSPQAQSSIVGTDPHFFHLWLTWNALSLQLW